MGYKPWEVQKELWKQKCKWGNSQSKSTLTGRISQQTGKSTFDTLRDLRLAEKSGMLKNKGDGSAEIK